MISKDKKVEIRILTDICYSIADAYDNNPILQRIRAEGFDFIGPGWLEKTAILGTPLDVISFVGTTLEGFEVKKEKWLETIERFRICNKWLDGAFDETISLLEQYMNAINS